MMAVADSILDFADTCQKEYSTIFLYNFPIQDADDTHLITGYLSRERTNTNVDA